MMKYVDHNMRAWEAGKNVGEMICNFSPNNKCLASYSPNPSLKLHAIMVVKQFNTEAGLYVFELKGVETEFHSHPAVECILALKGDFTLHTESQQLSKLKLAVIPANLRHKLSSEKGELKIIMIEHHKNFLVDQLQFLDVDFTNGYFVKAYSKVEISFIEKMIQEIDESKAFVDYDVRVASILEFMSRHDLDYTLMMDTLCNITQLSQSRLSHIFKTEVGVSLKKYLIWSKLKSTIRTHLNEREDLFSSLIRSGFYDQPHFSKNFKDMLGVNPSKAYNSRNLQVLNHKA